MCISFTAVTLNINGFGCKKMRMIENNLRLNVCKIKHAHEINSREKRINKVGTFGRSLCRAESCI